MPANKKKDSEWGVRDKNARQLADDNSGKIIPRVHEVRPGFMVPLTFDQPYYMQERDARVFLKDPAFVVTDENDNVVPPLSEAAMLRSAPDKLAPNMVIADVHELTEEALLTRVAQVAGGTQFSASTPREVLIRFLIDDATAGSTAVQRAAASDEEGAAEAEDMDEADAAKLLEGR